MNDAVTQYPTLPFLQVRYGLGFGVMTLIYIPDLVQAHISANRAALILVTDRPGRWWPPSSWPVSASV